MEIRSAAEGGFHPCRGHACSAAHLLVDTFQYPQMGGHKGESSKWWQLTKIPRRRPMAVFCGGFDRFYARQPSHGARMPDPARLRPGLVVQRRGQDSNLRSLAGSPVFKTGALNHSATSPGASAGRARLDSVRTPTRDCQLFQVGQSYRSARRASSSAGREG